MARRVIIKADNEFIAELKSINASLMQQGGIERRIEDLEHALGQLVEAMIVTELANELDIPD